MRFITGLFILLLPHIADARFGIGAQLGVPTGLTAKHWAKSAEALDAALAWDLGPGNHFLLQSSYLWHQKDALYVQDAHPLDVYFGAGGRMKFAEEIHLGLRLPVGVAHYSQAAKAEAFGEVAPVFDLLPEIDWELQLAVGIRIYFD